MIKTRLLKLLSHARKYVVLQVLWQWISLLCQVLIIWFITSLVAGAFGGTLTRDETVVQAILIFDFAIVRYAMDRLYSRAGYLASVDVKRVLREKIYAKLLRLGASYREKTASSQVVQMATEGVEQLETYFGKYLSQFFYALLAPLTLFLILMRVSLRAAVVLLVAVPLIPIVIMVVMMVARRLLDRYFNIYYGLGDSFLEKLQGLTTLKVYQADQEAADDMDRESEKFRRITMKVLSMQLNSTAVMDIVAYGGAAVGMVVALQEFYAGNVGLQGALLIILLGAEFFLPTRLLGSYFHIGMNGMKASDRIFEFLDTPEPDLTGCDLPEGPLSLELRDVTFSYDGDRQVLDHVSLKASPGSFVSLVGVSGSGKSTIASLLMGKNRSYGGEVLVGGVPLREVSEASLMRRLTLVSHDSYLFEGTVRDNLQMACPAATDARMNDALARVQLLGFVTAQGGLDMHLDENAANLSGGQRQRLALARALLHDSDGYIFDEATSNIDMESEEMIMRVIRELARTKTVVLISHRLANVTQSDAIYFLERGAIAEQGTHEQLMARGGSYARLFASQSALESNAELNAEEEEVPTAVIASGVPASEVSPMVGQSAAPTSGVPITNEPASAGRESSSPRRRGGLAIMRRLIVLVRPLAGVMCLGIALGVVGFLCAIFLTLLAGEGVVEGLGIAAGGSGYSGWTALFTAMLVVAFARGFLHYGEQYCNHYIAFRILAIIRHKVFAALRKLCPAKLEGKDKGDLISLITSDIELLEVFYAHTISPIAIAVVVSAVMVAYIGHFNALAGLVAAAGYVTVGVIIPLWNGRRGSQAGLDFRNALGALSSFVLQALYGLDETIQYGAGQKTLGDLDARSRKLANLQKRMSGFEASQRSVTNLAIQGFSLLMLLVMLGAYGAGACGFEALVLCVIAMMGSFGPVTALSNLSNSLNQTLASGERVLSLLDETPAVEEVEGEQDVAFEGAEVEHVTFSYGGGNNSVAVFPTIDVCSLAFPKGHIIGIHGRSGSGKSTLLKLLMRFWDVQRGSVEISGHDIRRLNTSNLRQMEGYVMQDTWLFHDTIANNIAVGKPGASQEEIEEAAKKASIHDFIVSLPQGYQTNVGELGDALSGGERQRIGIARAILHDADFILLDEPTSNLDALNEGIILRSLKEEAAGRTIVLVSHRQSTMAIADTVYEMAGGRPS